MTQTAGNAGINTQLVTHDIGSGREITYFTGTGARGGVTTSGGTFYSISGYSEDLLFRTPQEAQQYAIMKSTPITSQVGVSDVPSSVYWQQKQAKEEAAKAAYGGVRTETALAPIGEPVPGSQLAMKKEFLESKTAQWGSGEQFKQSAEQVSKLVPVNASARIVSPGYPSGEEQLKAIQTPTTTTAPTKTDTGLPSLKRDINKELGLDALNLPKGKPIDVSGLPVIAVTPARPYVEPTKYTTQPALDISRQITQKTSEFADIILPQTRPFDVPTIFPKEFVKGVVKSVGSVPEFFASGLVGAEAISREISAGRGSTLPDIWLTGASAIATGIGTQFKTAPVETLGSFAGQILFFEGVARIPAPRGLKIPEIKFPERTFYDPLVGTKPKSAYVSESLGAIKAAGEQTPYIGAYTDFSSRISAMIKVSKESPTVPIYTEAGIPGTLGEIRPSVPTPRGYIGYSTDVLGIEGLKARFKPDIRGAFGDMFKTERGYIFSTPDIAQKIGFRPDIRAAFGDMFQAERGYVFSYPNILERIGFKPDIRGALGDIGAGQRVARGYIGYSTDIFRFQQLNEFIQKIEQRGYVAKEKVKGKYKTIQEQISEELNRPVRYFGEYGKKVEYEPYPTLKERKVTGTIRLIKGKYGEPIEPKELKPKTVEAAGINAKVTPSRRMTRGKEVLRQSTKELITTPKQIIEQIPAVTEKPKEQLSPYALVFGGAPVLAGTQLLKGGRSGLSFKTPAERIEEMFFISSITQRAKPKERQEPTVKPGESSILKPTEIIISRPKELPKERPKEIPRERTRDLTRDLSRDLVRDVTKEATRESQRDTQIQRELEIFRPPKPILLMEERKKRKYTPKPAGEKYFQTFRGVNLIQPLAGIKDIKNMFKMPAKPSHKKSRKGRRGYIYG